MALRPPQARRVRRTRRERAPDVVRCGVAALLLVVVGLRFSMALLGVATWTVSWRLVAWASAPAIWPLHQFGGLRTEVAGHLTVGELMAIVIVGVVAAYLLASLTVRESG